MLYAAVSVNKDLTLAVTSDRGLCGGLNSNITKYTKALMRITASDAGGVGSCSYLHKYWLVE